jgi:hypothetical protein
MAIPVLVGSIPAQIVNEQAAFGPFDLKEFITSVDSESDIRFSGELTDGRALPKGMICTEDGLLTGIPAKGTQGDYEIKITAQNDDGEVEALLVFTIKPSIVGSITTDYIDQLKAQVWEALEQKLPLPEIGSIYDRPVTIQEVYYLLERWATLTIWDALNLDHAGDKFLLNLEGASPHYEVYDRGSCLVACPKDLFSHERTLEDSLQTARAMAREVYKRGWIIEFAGFEKMERAAWVEIQHLEDQFGKKLEILHYDPTLKELRIYTEEAKEQAIKRAEQP